MYSVVAPHAVLFQQFVFVLSSHTIKVLRTSRRSYKFICRCNKQLIRVAIVKEILLFGVTDDVNIRTNILGHPSIILLLRR